MAPRRHPLAAALLAAAVTVGAVAVGACDNTVEPFVDDPQAYFSVTGYLDADADTQFVRVGALRTTPALGDAPLDAVVATTVAETGQRVAWRDSLVRLDDGTRAHLFYAPFRAVPGHHYTLTVTRSDGRATTAATQVPTPLPVDLGAVTDTTGRGLQQAVTWVGLRRPPERVTVRYVVRPPEAAAADTVAFSYAVLGDFSSRGLTFSVLLDRDRNVVLSRLDRPRDDTTVVLLEVHMAIRRLSEAWFAPAGEQGVRNGFGFFGSAATVSAAWRLDSLAAARIGYRTAAE